MMTRHFTAVLVSLPMLTAAVAAQETVRVSVGSQGTQANGASNAESISADGRFVAFSSWASNLLPPDLNGRPDVFVHDRATRETWRITNGDHESKEAVISQNGRYLAFQSRASNLVPGDTNGLSDVFHHDRWTGVTKIVTVSATGVLSNAATSNLDMSDDGRFVAFTTSATNLVEGDTNASSDVFLHDCQTGYTMRVSVDTKGNQGDGDSGGEVSLSNDGRYVVFGSAAKNLVPGDTNDSTDKFIKDIRTGEIERLNVTSSGQQSKGNVLFRGAVSDDGRFVVFSTKVKDLVPNKTTNFWEAYVRDRRLGLTWRLSVDPNGNESDSDSWASDISGDGSIVLFESRASNLVPGDTNGSSDVFMHELATGQTTRISVSTQGWQGNGFSGGGRLSRRSASVIFSSDATNLIMPDSNGTTDGFVREIGGVGPLVETYCTAKKNSCAAIPTISSVGLPSVAASSGFTIRTSGAREGNMGFLLYTPSGAAIPASPFQGGLLCVSATNLLRSLVVYGQGGTLGGGCDAYMEIDWNSFAAGGMGGDPAPFLNSPGQRVDTQWWGRDHQNHGSLLSEALGYLVRP